MIILVEWESLSCNWSGPLTDSRVRFLLIKTIRTERKRESRRGTGRDTVHAVYIYIHRGREKDRRRREWEKERDEHAAALRQSFKSTSRYTTATLVGYIYTYRRDSFDVVELFRKPEITLLPCAVRNVCTTG